jgi:hypothetical protein
LHGELKISHLLRGVIARSSASGVTLKPVSGEVSMITGVPPHSSVMSG